MKPRSHKELNPGLPAAQGLFQRLERLEEEGTGAHHTGHHRWMIPYADLLTLLLGLFLVLLTAVQAEKPPEPEAMSMAALQESAKSVKDSAKVSIHGLDEVNASAREDMQLATTLKQELQSDLDIRGMDIRPQERGLVISLKDSILFAPGSAELSPQARQTLDRLADKLNRVLATESRPIRVEGHTDNAPIDTAQFPSNWELSTARATNILRYLVSGHHFSPDRMAAAGYGEFKPVADNSTIEGKQKNRRVDIVVLNNVSAQDEPPISQAR